VALYLTATPASAHMHEARAGALPGPGPSTHPPTPASRSRGGLGGNLAAAAAPHRRPAHWLHVESSHGSRDAPSRSAAARPSPPRYKPDAHLSSASYKPDAHLSCAPYKPDAHPTLPGRSPVHPRHDDRHIVELPTLPRPPAWVTRARVRAPGRGLACDALVRKGDAWGKGREGGSACKVIM